MYNYFEGMYRMYLMAILAMILINVVEINTGNETITAIYIFIVGVPTLFAAISGFLKKNS